MAKERRTSLSSTQHIWCWVQTDAAFKSDESRCKPAIAVFQDNELHVSCSWGYSTIKIQFPLKVIVLEILNNNLTAGFSPTDISQVM